MTDFMDDEGRCAECGCDLVEGCTCDPKCEYCTDDTDDGDFELVAGEQPPKYNVCESCQ